MMENLKKRIKKWWEGEYIPPQNDPNSSLMRLLGHQKRPLLVLIVTRIGKIWIDHWYKIIMILLGIITVLIMYQQINK